MIKRTEHFKVD